MAAIASVIVSVGAAYGGSERCERSSVPRNVALASDLGRAFQHIYERSPTFRAQCERIGEAANLRVRVRLNTVLPRNCRALTTIERYGAGMIRADVYLPPGSDYSELIAHEFEHLLEQIEGLNLRRLSRLRGSGVREVDRELFESDRAQAAGRIVYDEVRQFRATD
jgi:hypothetical protein